MQRTKRSTMKQPFLSLLRFQRYLPIAVVVLMMLTGIFAFSGTALAATGGFSIDGTVPDVGVSHFDDPFGGASELGPVNSASTKLGVINTAPLPTLGFTTINGKED